MLGNKIELRPGREVKKDAWYKFVMAVKVSQNPQAGRQAVGGVQPLLLTMQHPSGSVIVPGQFTALSWQCCLVGITRPGPASP